MSSPARVWLTAAIIVIVLALVSGCLQPPSPASTPTPTPLPVVSRESAIPADAVKQAPEGDAFVPVLHSEDWEKPVPMEGPVNTAGAEDSPFITPDGSTFYFFFAPDVRVPPEKQLVDGATGVYWTKKVSGRWAEPERLVLHDDVSLDGCVCVQGDTLWFASVRAGNVGTIDVFTATQENGKWAGWKRADEQLNKQYDIGEFHVTPDGRTIYFGRVTNGTGDSGSIWENNRDIWMSEKVDGRWSEPVNLGPNVNSAGTEDQPFISQDGNELWFTGQSRLGYTGPSVFRSVKTASGEWGPAEEIVSNFAGEPTLDAAGNIYFVHHYFKGEKMIEADIYVARKK